MKCVAVDDEQNALEVIDLYVKKVDTLELAGKFTDPIEASRFLSENKIDLLFLDINMKGLNGFELLETLNYKPKVIFTTAYSEYAVKSYTIDALDYLVKPIPFGRFLKAVNKAEQDKTSTHSMPKEEHKDEIISIKSGTVTHRVKLSDILYIQADGNYIKYVTATAKILELSNMKETLAKLNDSFIQTHRSYIVSVDKITKIENHQIHIAEHKIPVGISFRKTINDRLK
ncbi:LytR/AlgR family response regulator transcription factor [Fulvivirga lutimaris]|uniref:LytR/AlgR family response regulator transcription factor n=1 Tax=Fulvivirga lutimaris TaxID=1819566 RepID=UPI0012BBBD34|nr:LytTR family DNA-binding domain-containing protein [Fulvivirga lutimaris]MTI40500.1 response regulator transcription factor [Fulvivirga lutimaris]